MNLIERAVARIGAKLEQSDSGPLQIDDSPRVDPVAPARTDSDRIAVISGKAHIDPPARSKGLPVFGPAVVLPLTQMRDRGYVTPAARATATGQEFRSLKGPVLEKAFGSDTQRVARGQRVLVTSALPGEGKTFCAINLAISIAVTGECSVLLLDADVARPSIAQELGMEPSPGLVDALTGDHPTLFSLIRPTDVPGLSVLPAGSLRAHAGEHLAGSAMASLLDQLSAALPNWLIIIDTPPLLAITETRSLAQRAGQVLMVVAAGETPRKTVATALTSIEDLADISLILNKTPQSRTRLDYYYGY